MVADVLGAIRADRLGGSDIGDSGLCAAKVPDEIGNIVMASASAGAFLFVSVQVVDNLTVGLVDFLLVEIDINIRDGVSSMP